MLNLTYSKKVDVFINVSQSLNGRLQKDVADKFELFTTGVLKKIKKGWVVKYNNEYNGVSKIYLMDDEQKINILTNGDIFYTLKLDKNKITKFSCKTKDTFSYFSVVTNKIFFKIDEQGGTIDIEYGLEIDELSNILKNRLKIEIK